MNNPLQINDWNIRKFLILVLSIQLALWAALCLDFLGIRIPLLRQVIGFIYLTFIPGILVLRILKLHKLDRIEVLSYSVGLSLTTLMLTGLIINNIYPLLGISNPISFTPLAITISAIVLLLCVLCYRNEDDFADPFFMNIKGALSLPALFLCIIPFLAIFGTYLMNSYQNNVLLMLLIVIISLVAILIGFDAIIPPNLYSLAVFIISISLLYHRSLISMFLVELGDISFEYWTSKTIVMNSIWNPVAFGNLNAMLSIVFLLPIYSIIMGVDLIWVIKIVSPLLFSLLPLILYRVYQKQTSDKIAFLSCFFFMSMFSFYEVMLGAVRQQLAELFFVLLILLIIDISINRSIKSILFIAFSSSLIVSHYGLTYLFMLSFIIAWAIPAFAKNPAIKSLANLFQLKFRIRIIKRFADSNLLNLDNKMINSNLLLIFITCTLVWYLYVSCGSAFNTIVYIGDHILSSITTDILNPKSTQGLDIILKSTTTILGNLNKAIHLTTQVFISIGLVVTLLRYNQRIFNCEFNYKYLHFSLPFFGMCLAGVVIPYFASALNTTRLYQICLIILAPFCVIGGMSVLKILGKVVGTSWTNENMRHSLRMLSIIFVIYLFLNSGFMYELAKQPVSFSLNTSAFFAPHFNEKEVISADWLRDNMNYQNKAYADAHNAYLLQMSIGYFYPITFFNGNYDKLTKINIGSYIFLGRENTVNGNILLDDNENPRLNCKRISLQNLTFNQILHKMNKLYNNGDAAVVLFHP